MHLQNMIILLIPQHGKVSVIHLALFDLLYCFDNSYFNDFKYLFFSNFVENGHETISFIC